MVDPKPRASVAQKRYAKRPMPSNFKRFAFNRNGLPSPPDFYAGQGVVLLGKGAWRSALCPFHKDAHPSLRVLLHTGAFRCMACGAHGGDVLSFYMLRLGADLRAH